MKTGAQLRFALILLLALTLVARLALAQGEVERPREVLGAGASESAATGLSLRGTLGQPVVGMVSSSGGEVTVGQGFWHQAPYHTYLPVVFRNKT
jgi:hypothetical protein